MRHRVIIIEGGIPLLVSRYGEGFLAMTYDGNFVSCEKIVVMWWDVFVCW